jgi:hypothetical protein
MPISHPVQVKPFGNCNPVTKCDNESTSFVSTPKQPLAPPSMQGLSGFHSSYYTGLIRPM